MIGEKELKKIPYGISDFEDFHRKNLYYVDKTRFIHNIEDKGSFLFLIRPRRFGKSLLLSMLENHYDIARKDQFDTFFVGTDIHKYPIKEKSSYMVLKFNFSKVQPSNIELKQAFMDYIRSTTHAFVNKYNQFLDIDLEKFSKEVDSRNNASSILDYLLIQCERKKIRLYVIIDEYDNFANTILSDSGESHYLSITHGEGFLRSFFNVVKSGTTGSGSPISRLFMTGVSPITLDDVTSGFNIATNISLDSDINEIMGFTQSEVETLIEYYRQAGKIIHPTSVLIEIMSRWYNHYRFSQRAVGEMFNTSQVLYFLNKYIIDGSMPLNFIDRNALIDYEKLRQFIIIDKKDKKETNGNFLKLKQVIETGTTSTVIQEGFPIQSMGKPENFFSLLFYFGLLTITGETPGRRAILSVPNEFTWKLYYDYLHSIYDETNIFKIDSDRFSLLMEEMAIEGKWEEAISYVAERMNNSLGVRDLIDREKALQVFWNVYFGLNPLYIVDSEKELNQGFADLALVPVLAQFPGIKYSYLIEFKYIKPADYEKADGEEKVKNLRMEAETQLNRYSMDEKFKKTIGQTTLKKLVLIFSGNRMVLGEEI